MKQTIKTIWNAISTAMVCIVVIFAILLVGVKLVGLDVFIVLSGSMEPEYHTGSVIYVKKIDDPSDLKVKDVITFRLSEDTIATHRIIELVEEDGQIKYRTKGDANEVEDAALVTQSQLVGTPVFTIPLLGYVVSYIQKPPGLYVAVSVGAVMLLVLLLPDILFGDDDDKKKKQKEQPAEELPEQTENNG